MPSVGQVERMRATAAGALPDTATVRRLTRVPSGGGGYTDSWVDVATVACRIAPVGGGEGATVGDAVSDRTTHVVTLPALTDVAEADRLVVDGQTLEVTLAKKRGTWELSRRCEVVET